MLIFCLLVVFARDSEEMFDIVNIRKEKRRRRRIENDADSCVFLDILYRITN